LTKLSAGAKNVVALLERLDPILSRAHALLELGETGRQRLRDLTDSVRSDVRLFLQVGLGDRIGDVRRLGRLARGHADVHHVGAFGALDLNAAFERVQGGSHAVGTLAPGLAGKFRILVEGFGFDHAPQHAVGGQYANLALDLQHGRVVGQICRREFVADRVQIGRIDQNLRHRRIAMRHDEHEHHGDKQRSSRRP
jgi:hypothetical protein